MALNPTNLDEGKRGRDEVVKSDTFGAEEKRKKSRFGEQPDIMTSNSNSGSGSTVSAAIAAAAARAAQIAQDLKLKSESSASYSQSNPKLQPSAPTPLPQPFMSTTSAFGAGIGDIQAQIAAQIASVSSLLNSAQSTDRRVTFRTLRLDSLGREVDDKGNLVRTTGPIKTLAANVAEGQAQKKKENPYLLHRVAKAVSSEPEIEPENIFAVDERLKLKSRDVKAKKAFNFVEAGKYIKEADLKKAKEERKIIAGYASGRKAPEQILDVANDEDDSAPNETSFPEGESNRNESSGFVCSSVVKLEIPCPCDERLVPSLEWWDEYFLPKDVREARRRSIAIRDQNEFHNLLLFNCKTYKYIQHPVPLKALGGEKGEEALPMYLTKKERKRLRRKAREEREREKRDMQMMGLIKAPEPKFKLSNFMKVLGDQAVADPSKVEQKVMQQVKERLLVHEMRNQAAKLTPAEKKEKQRRKMTEDTSRQVHVALFRVRNFSSTKHRFKVDVNAQQCNLTGTVLLCKVANANLVLFEGGRKGIRKITRLMLHRIPWDSAAESDANPTVHDEPGSNATGDNMTLGEKEDLNSDDDFDKDANGILSSGGINRCDLLWQGIIPKRNFHAFRFQECRTSSSARKVLEAKGIPHYWDMVARADDIIEAELAV